MMTNHCLYFKATRPTIVVTVMAIASAALMLSACAPQSSPPKEVQAENPSVTYKYRGDEELVHANQSAETYCSQYHAIAQTADIKDSSDGSKTVVFNCMPTSSTQMSATSVPNSNLSYLYESDQQLLDASRNADVYCATNGSQRATATVVTNTDGTKTATFRCTP